MTIGRFQNGFAGLISKLSFASLLAATLLIGTAHQVRAQATADAVTSCSNTISTCGCTITKTGVYIVNAPLNSGQGLTDLGDCIDIKAKNVVLNVADKNITGPGTSTGIGIHLLRSANGAFIEGDDARVTAWNIGMEIDASNVITDWVQTQNDTQAGTFLNNTKNDNINDFNISGNSIYGVWIREGSNNQINCSNSDSNGKIGLYVGCHSDGTHGTKCKGFGPSKNNRLFDHSADDNGDAGIVIDLGNTGNLVGDFTASGNAGSFDSIDDNPSCDNDVWLAAGGSYGTANQSCIP